MSTALIFAAVQEQELAFENPQIINPHQMSLVRVFAFSKFYRCNLLNKFFTLMIAAFCGNINRCGNGGFKNVFHYKFHFIMWCDFCQHSR